MTAYSISIKDTIVWTALYFTICGILPTLVNITIWRNFGSIASTWLNLLSLAVFNGIFLLHLTRKHHFSLNVFNSISLKGILLAIGCAILFYFLLDKFLDPLLDSLFTTSAERYRETILELQKAPLANFLRICLLAPIVEEILMRGLILHALQERHSIILALLVSSLLFAILHFNFGQTVSTFICGLVLGILYLRTGSLFSCIAAHSLYNAISFQAIVHTRL